MISWESSRSCRCGYTSGPACRIDVPGGGVGTCAWQEFADVKLSDYRGKYVVLFFYPLDFTFVCPTEITAFSDRHSDFSELNTEILGVSVDSEYSHLAWIQTDRKDGMSSSIRPLPSRQLARRDCACVV
eukprot:scaffold467_cov403-Prasinococcus_capsulatus_cf.AAC.6